MLENGALKERLVKKRATSTRSRNGCLTCRTRRIKCDETKPTCTRCATSGWKCEGYAKYQKPPPRALVPNRGLTLKTTSSPVFTFITSTQRQLASLSKTNSLPTLRAAAHSNPPITIFTSLFQNEEERFYFDRFQKTARELSGFFSTAIWGRLMLQASHKEVFVKHAVLAIAALDMTLEYSRDFSNQDRVATFSKQSKLENPHYAIAFREYEKALRLMRTSKPLDDDDGTRNMLLSCLLTMIFEGLHGSMNHALAQAVVGTTLCNSWMEREAEKGARLIPRISPRPEAIETELVASFSRLDLQFKTMSIQGLPQRKADLEALDDMPTIFTSIEEAKYYFELVNRLTMSQNHFTRRRNTRLVSRPGIGNISVILEQNTAEISKSSSFEESLMYNRLDGDLARLYSALEPLLLRSQTPEGEADLLPALVLLVHWTGLPFVTRAAFHHDNETWCDAFLPAMKECIRLLRRILEIDYGTEPLPHKPKFRFEVQYMPVLHTIVVKCRDFATRREAMELFEKYPTREGFWDSKMALANGKAFMAIEEEGLEWGAYIPEERRLKIIRQEIGIAERFANFHCARSPGDGEELEILPVIPIKW